MGTIHSRQVKRVARNKSHMKEAHFVQLPNKAVFSHRNAIKLARALRRNTNLDILELSDLKQLSPSDYAAIFNAVNFSRLKNLQISSAKLGNEGVTALINLLSPSTPNSPNPSSPIRSLTLTSIALEPSKITALTATLRLPASPVKELILVDTGIDNYEHVAALTDGLSDCHLDSLSIVAVNHNTEEYGIRAIIHLFAKVNVSFVSAAIKTVNESAAYKFADVLIANNSVKSFSLLFEPLINKIVKARVESSGKFICRTETIPSGFVTIDKYTWTRL